MAESVVNVDSTACRRTVMVVEDCHDVRGMLKIMLEVAGYHVVEAPHGGEAVRLAVRLLPDLIVMDVGLPVLNGYDAIRLIHAEPELRQVPIVVSAHTERRWREEALAAGCAAFVAKPLDLQQFGALIGQLVS